MSTYPPGPQPVEVNGEMVLYGDGRTKQAFADDADINKMLAKAQRTGSLSHLAKHGGFYGDFSDIDDLLDAHDKLQRGVEIFEDLPSELRKEFHNDAGNFFRYVNDPQNSGELGSLFEKLAEPGRAILRPNTGRSLEDPGPTTAEPSSPPQAAPASSDAPNPAPSGAE